MADETDRAPDAAPTSAFAGFCERLHCFFAGTVIGPRPGDLAAAHTPVQELVGG